MSDELKPCPSLNSMQSYAEAAMRHGFLTALKAVEDGSISGSWDRNWFEANPPQSAIPDDEWEQRNAD